MSDHHTTVPAGMPLRDGSHYLHLLGRARWYILISGPAILLAAVAFVFLVVRPENPELTARALIGLERTTDVSGVKEGATANLGREDIMMSRTFLKGVARKLSLQLSTVPYGRNEMFDSISIDSSASCGTYCVRFSPQTKSEFLIYYYDTTAISLPIFGFLPTSKFTIIARGNWSSDMPVHLSAMSLKFSRSVRARPHAFTFHVVDIRVAVEAVYRNLTIKRADPDKGINYIAVLLAGRDYSLAAATANAIADGFIEKNSSFRRLRALGIVGSLDKQLQLSQTNLSAAEAKIRDFRSANPQVGLNQQTQQTVSSLARLDNGIQNMSADGVNAMRLKNAFVAADSSLRRRIADQITELLSSHSIPAGRTLHEELSQLTVQQHVLNATYGAEHPMVLENKRAINKVISAISEMLDEYIGNTQATISMKQQNVRQLSGTLRQLPAQEMQLGELQRNQQIYADIYSAVLSSYNKAKVADAVETTDFYVMDYAVAPLPPPADPSQLLVICVILALLSSFGPVLAFDLFDKSVRSQRQLARITSKLVLEAIPVFSPAGEKHLSHRPDFHPLITAPCDPNYTKEIFDSLLMKINLLLHESTDRSIAISSFESGCGKSTLSANLAVAIAMRGHRTLLVDGDLRRGTVKEIFKLPDSGGLASLLSGQKALTDYDYMTSISRTNVPRLYVLPSGREPQNPGALLSSVRMEQFKRFFEKHMDYIILDTPPLGIVSDAVVVKNLFAYYIFVVRSGKTNVTSLVNRINEFDLLPDKILGYVLNCASHEAVGTYRRYSKYYDTRPRVFTQAKHKPLIRFPSVVRAAAASLVILGISAIIFIPHFSKRTGRTMIEAAVTAPLPDKSSDRSIQSPVETSRSMVVSDWPESKSPMPRNQSDIPATHSKIEKTGKRSAAVATRPKIVDSAESTLAILREIRSKSAQGNLAALGSIFNGPALNDGEYYVWMARYLCGIGEWRKAVPLVEKALTVPAHGLSDDNLTKEYLFCKAKCLGTAFDAEPTPARGADAMEAWYNVKSGFRGSPRDFKFLYADRELRRVSKEVNGK